MRRIAAILVLAVVIVAFGATVAGAASAPFDTNSECLECHAVNGVGSGLQVDFSVAAVNYDACKVCHGKLTTAAGHEHGGYCETCHYTGEPVTPSLYDSPYGLLKSVASLGASPQQLHAVHVNMPRLDIKWNTTGCEYCHAPVGCNTCHLDQGTHGSHAGTATPAVTYDQTDGLNFAPRQSTCVNSACHALSNASSAAFVPSCSSCHSSNVNAHGSAADHSYSAASDYSDATQTGCSNSGSGCHGSDATYADIRTTYGHDGCTTGPCHTSAGKGSVSAKLECVKCHSGSYVGAPNRASLGSAFPGGHFNETTHTTTAMARTVSSGGVASATCSTCHDDGLRSVHATITSATYGTNLTCYECHNDTGSGGNAQVLSNWTSDRCEDCHTAGASAPMHSATGAPVVTGLTSAGCTTGTGCHATDLHALHKDAASCALSGCHTSKNVTPTSKTCGTGGACHTTAVAGHKPHQTVTTKLTTDATWKTACGSCHGTTHSNTTCGSCHAPTKSRDVHAVGTHMTNARCGSCHNIASTDTALNCLSCHPGGTKPAPTVPVTYGTVTGIVRDSAGLPLQGALVAAGSVSASTDSVGRYTLASVPTGAVSVTVTKAGYAAQTKSGTVSSGLSTAIDFTLSAASTATTGTVTGVITDAATGTPLAGVVIVGSGVPTLTTDAQGRFTVTGIAAGTYSLTLSKSGYTTKALSVTATAGQTVTANSTMSVASGQVNHALAGTASASSAYSATYDASKAKDGSTSTYWRSADSATQWLRIDLGSTKSVGRVVVNWEAERYAKAYRIETSLDGTTWTTRYSTTAGAIGVRTHSFTAVDARYVRIYCTSPQDGHYRLRELETWNF